MARPESPYRHPQAALLPAGRRWGTGVESLTPYLREAWSQRPRNPVFTPDHVATLVWSTSPRLRQSQAAPRCPRP